MSTASLIERLEADPKLGTCACAGPNHVGEHPYTQQCAETWESNERRVFRHSRADLEGAARLATAIRAERRARIKWETVMGNPDHVGFAQYAAELRAAEERLSAAWVAWEALP